MIKNITVFTILLLITFGIIELASRVILPISPGVKKTDLDGNEIDISWNAENTTFIQTSPEWHLTSSNDELGNRIVPTANEAAEKILFLGDSFTYGLGVTDEGSIPNIVCKAAKLNCVNLGVPGSGMVVQKDKLITYLQTSQNENISTIYHLIMASTEQNFSGNDITDTNIELSTANSVSVEIAEDPVLLKVARWSSKNSNFVRIMRFYLGSWLRSVIFKSTDSGLSEQEIENFAQVMTQISQQAESQNINYVPLLVSPYSELANNTYLTTREQIQNQTSLEISLPDYSTTKAAASLFYPLDGHFNEAGAKFYGEFIIESYFSN